MAAAKKKAAFTIDSEVLRQLEERVPEPQRSQFVEDALAKALAGSGRATIAKKIREAELVDGVPGDSTAILRQLRDQRIQYIAERN